MRVADPDPGSGAFLTPVLGSRIRDKHPGSATLVGWEVRLFQEWPIRVKSHDCLYNISQIAWASQPRLENVQTGLSGLGLLGPATLSHLLWCLWFIISDIQVRVRILLHYTLFLIASLVQVRYQDIESKRSIGQFVCVLSIFKGGGGGGG